MTAKPKSSWRELLKDVMQVHADKDSPDYNECDVSPCAWCEDAKTALSTEADKTDQEIADAAMVQIQLGHPTHGVQHEYTRSHVLAALQRSNTTRDQLLNEIYDWLHGFEFGRGGREHFHEKIGKLLGKEPVEYGE